MSIQYELTEQTQVTGDGTTVYRIRALADLPEHGVRCGELGGFVESSHNLTAHGWVDGQAKV